MKSSAFTLLELTVALAIGAMLVAVAAFSLRGPYLAAKLAGAVEQVALFDQLVRSHARRTGRPTELVIDLTHGALAAGEPQPGQPMRRLELDAGVRIERIELPGKRLSQGKVAVPISGEGHSSTYLLRLRGADQKTKRILFAGVSGQSVELHDDYQVEQLFEKLTARRADSD